MIKKIRILEVTGEDKVNEPDIKLKVKIQLNKMILSILRKTKSLEVVEDFSRVYKIDLDSEIDEIVHKFYKEYLKEKDVEDYWTDKFTDAEVIQINLIEDDEEED